jgi:hypothetical protein
MTDVQAVTRRTAPPAAEGAAAVTVTTDATAAKPARKRVRVRAEDQQPAPSSGKVPGRARQAGPGATVRSQGHKVQIESVSDFKASLRSTIKDAASLDAAMQQRQTVYEARRTEANEGFSKMQENLTAAEALRVDVTSRLAEIVKLMPRELVSGLNVKETAEVAVKTGMFANFVKMFQKKQAEKPALSEQSISQALMTQIDLLEAVTRDLQNKHEVLENSQAEHRAARMEFAQLLENAVNDLNDVMEVHYEVNQSIDTLKEAIANPDTPPEELADAEKQLILLTSREQELTRLAMFLKHSTENYRTFERNAEQLATMTTTVLGNTEISLAKAFQIIETQSTMATVIAKVADVLRASDLLNFTLEETQLNLEAVATHMAKSVTTHLSGVEAVQARITASQNRIYSALKGANEASAAELRKFSDTLIKDYEAGNFETCEPINIPKGLPVSASPLRARSKDIEARLAASVKRSMAMNGVLPRTGQE